MNIGGILAVKEDEELFRACQALVVPYEGFPPTGPGR